ncbi:MAG: glycosyltransferase family 4 protein [Armatimonadota bacterium]|nr:glycosyltransferase family 4 protein [Armatimonadota bacterium]MDR7438927.1 glycosyltransferase family 4 protein [Armatimonadota bacterium]MDR7563234.1 glycosyltransferase family 4 protein [Armatimonadota bacterium]MDR7601338.1 glycosyltransferase family 4 protein [Armatimonadota bacterium]
MARGLLLTNDFPPMVGGEARMYARICRSIPPDRVLVLAPHLPDDVLFDLHEHYPIVRVRVPTSPHPAARAVQITRMLLAARRLVRSNDIHVLHIGHLYLGPVGLALRRWNRIPYVLYLHGGEMAPYMRSRVVRKLVQRVVEEASLVVANSRFTLAHYEAMGMRPRRAEVLPPVADTRRFRPDLDPNPARERYGLGNCGVVLTVGRLVQRKGHDLVLRALAALGEEAGPVRYVIAGSGPEERRLRDLAEALGVRDRVVFAGYVPDEELPGLYAACDVFVMPSRALEVRDGIEGFGTVFLEAGACGKPVVGGRSGGATEAVEDGVTGLLVDPHDPGALAEALRRLLRDPELRRRMGETGRARAKRLEAAWGETVRRLWNEALEARL